jgi:hypothetical protein
MTLKTLNFPLNIPGSFPEIFEWAFVFKASPPNVLHGVSGVEREVLRNFDAFNP